MDEGERLYNAYYMQVYSFLMAQTREQSLAEELTEQTFSRLCSTTVNTGASVQS